MTTMIYNGQGQRKYLTPAEIDAFVNASRNFPSSVRLFCMMIAYSGCRISEALSMTCSNLDFESQHVVIRCLKKRGKTVFRTIPLPARFLNMLQTWIKNEEYKDGFLWPWSRMTGYRRICDVMDFAKIRGHHASPKGLRHGFGIRAVQASVPLTLIQRWLGHADIKTTAIYTNAVGPEERRIASRMWRNSSLADAPTHDGITPPKATGGGNSTNLAECCPPCEEPSTQDLVNNNLTPSENLHHLMNIYPASATGSAKTFPGEVKGCSMIHFWLNRISKIRLISLSYAENDRKDHRFTNNPGDASVNRFKHKKTAEKSPECRCGLRTR